MIEHCESRALVIEDESLVAMLLEDMLLELGCGAVEVVSRFDDALELISKERFSFVILDLNLGGILSFPIADALLERRIPFAFSTGYDSTSLSSSGYAHIPVLQKPFLLEELRRRVDELLQAREHEDRRGARA